MPLCRPTPCARSPRGQVQALLDTVKEDPDSDVPRLILADWLEEYGDDHEVARAAFLRLQCDLARLGDGPQADLLRDRARELADRHQSAWLGTLPDWAGRATFVRGLLRLTLRAEAVPLLPTEPWLTSPEAGWVDDLCVEGGTALEAATLVETPLPLGLVAWRFLAHPDGPGIGVLGARILAAAPLRRLRVLDLYGNGIGPSGAAALAASPHLAGLTELKLDANALGAAGARALARAPWRRTLTALHLADNHLGPSGVQALLTGPLCESRLQRLFLDRNDLDADAVALLTAAPGLSALTVLDLSGNPLGDAGADILVRVPGLERLSWLNLHDTDLGRTARAALRRHFGYRVQV